MEWISVSSFLPKAEEPILFVVQSTNGVRYQRTGRFVNGCFYTSDWVPVENPVTHWMPELSFPEVEQVSFLMSCV